MIKNKTIILIIAVVFSLAFTEHHFGKPASKPIGQLPDPPASAESLNVNKDNSSNNPAGATEKPSDKGSIVSFKSISDKEKFLSSNNLTSSDLVATAAGAYQVNRPTDELVTSAGVNMYPNREYKALLTPNDPRYSQAWHLPKVSAPSGWDITTGNSTTTIAVIDTGFALNHEDLTGQWAAGGYDFVCNDTSPQAGDTDCDSNPSSSAASHGTMTAGLAGSRSNNGVGTASINWQAKILPLQALSDSGSGTTDDVATAIDYAVSHGANVISLSLGSTGIDNFLRQRIDAAVIAGVTIVAAAGNCGSSATYIANGCNNVGQVLDPAAYAPVVAIGATDSNDTRASFSSYGSALDIAAPGVSVPSTSWSAGNQTSAYGSGSGTSLATPIVASEIALLKSTQPNSTLQEFELALLKGADKVAGMNGQTRTDQYGYGRLNVDSSLKSLLPSPSMYHWSFNSEAYYTDSSKNTPLNRANMSPGQTAWLVVKAYNNGQATWYKDGTNQVNLATDRTAGRVSRFATPEWLLNNTPAKLNEYSVAPGQIGTFEFPVRIPAGSGSFKEYFNPVAQHITFFNTDVGQNFNFTVNQNYQWSWHSQAAYTNSSKSEEVNLGSMSPGQTAWLVVKANNVGQTTWYKDGTNQVNLATDRTAGRISRFATDAWLLNNTPAKLQETSVAPGQIGTFEFPITVPAGSGTFLEFFNPVAQHITFFNPEVGQYFQIIVHEALR